VEADVQQAQAVLKQRQAQVDNLRAGIEQEIEDALLDIKAAAQQVEVAKTGLDYAQQTLEQSQDRFAAGVTNNVEVIQAQQQLATANEQYIDSLYAHNIAKVLLARAIGNAEQAVKQYLSSPGNVVPTNPATPSNTPAAPAAPGVSPNAAPGTNPGTTPIPATPGAAPSTTPGPSALGVMGMGEVDALRNALPAAAPASTQASGVSSAAGHP
jgi:hypothetical protein